MKYALLIYPGRAVEECERLPEEDQRSILGVFVALGRERGVLGAEQLQPAEGATTVGVEDGKTLTTDGRSRTRRRFSAAFTCSRRTTSIGLPFVAHRNVLFTVACDLSRDATVRMLVGERPDARGR